MPAYPVGTQLPWSGAKIVRQPGNHAKQQLINQNHQRHPPILPLGRSFARSSHSPVHASSVATHQHSSVGPCDRQPLDKVPEGPYLTCLPNCLPTKYIHTYTIALSPTTILSHFTTSSSPTLYHSIRILSSHHVFVLQDLLDGPLSDLDHPVFQLTKLTHTTLYLLTYMQST